MRVASWLLIVAGLAGWQGVPAAGVEQGRIPSELAGWQDWVRHDQDYRDCPLMAGAKGDSPQGYLCAWPEPLVIAVSESGANFSQYWTLYARSALPLPGDGRVWPQSVEVNGVAAPVVRLAGRETPVIWLTAGRYRVSGRLDWSERPESIAVPGSIARIALSIDQRSVDTPQRDGESLWLGRVNPVEAEVDSLALQVFRVLEDRQPQRLVTRLRLRVSGKGRELVLPAALPQDFAPVSLEGALLARLEADGSLHVQARPGQYEITLVARALRPLDEIRAESRRAPWPEEEVWSYQSLPELRVTDAQGPPQVDPKLAEVPSGWHELPAFAMAAGAVLKISERGRGLSDQDQNRLSLTRELWLDFSGQGWTGRDQVQGRLVRDWRMDMSEPFVLTRASAGGEGLLVTTGAQPGWSGVELRERALALEASSRIGHSLRELPLTGWQQRFDAVATTLHLPPAYELIAAIGADRAPGAWLDRWDLLDVFYAALIAMLAVLVLGRLAALATVGYLLLAWHLPDAPRFALLLAFALAALAAAVRERSGLVRWSERLARVAWLAVAILTLPFAAGQVRQALYPQLEPAAYRLGYAQQLGTVLTFEEERSSNASAPGRGKSRGNGEFAAAEEDRSRAASDLMTAAEEPVPPPASAPPENKAVISSDSLPVAAKLEEPAKRAYTSDTVVQAGGGEPAWQWRDYAIEVAGPVLPSQSLRLLVSPPWLTRLARLAIVLLLLINLWRLGKERFALRLRLPRILPVAALIALLGSGSALAASTPDKGFVDQLGRRLNELPKCSPQCGRIARADVRFTASRIAAVLELHAAERLALPLPGNEKLLTIDHLSLDENQVGGLSRDPAGNHWIVVPRGVHRLRIEWLPASAEVISLRFPEPPGYTKASGSDWTVAGIDAGLLRSGSVQFSRLSPSGLGVEVEAGVGAGAGAAGVALDFPPYVIVTRQLRFDRDWTVTTSVQRIAPVQAAFTTQVPLLPGEHLLSDAISVADGQVSVPFAEGVHWFQWQSRLEPAEPLELLAPDQALRAEVWQVDASPGWHVVAEGLPAVHTESSMFMFHPLPAERLRLTAKRPQALPGNALAIDRVALVSRVGKRSSEHRLEFDLRATQGGQHGIDLPAGAQVTEVSVNEQLLNLRPERDRLSLPVRPGNNQVRLSWRDEVGAGPILHTPALALNAPSSNLNLQLMLPEDRWLLAASGPRVGPAVLYWGELLVMAVLALALARIGGTPLTGRDWLLLGIGFSTVSWWALLGFMAWLFALGWRARVDPALLQWRFNLVQIGLVLLTLLALSQLFGAIRGGLLGSPDLHVVGNQSSAHRLNWFDDQAAVRLPIASAISLPIAVYRALMLAWAFWMAQALIRWLRWGLGCFTEQAVWLPWLTRKHSTQAPPAPAPDADDASAGPGTSTG